MQLKFNDELIEKVFLGQLAFKLKSPDESLVILNFYKFQIWDLY